MQVLRFSLRLIARFADLGVDLANFLCISVNANVLKEHLDEVLAAYQQELVAALSHLSVDPSPYTLYAASTHSREAIQGNVAAHARWGIVVAFQWLPLMMRSSAGGTNLAADLAQAGEQGSGFLTLGKTNTALATRLATLVHLFHSRGAI